MNTTEIEELIRGARPSGQPSQPPIASIVRLGRRQRAARVATAVTAGAAAVAVSAAMLPQLVSAERSSFAPAGPSTSQTEARSGISNLSKDEAAGYLRDLPGVPLALPESLPPEYRWIGPSTYEQDASGAVDARSSTFARSEISQGPVVEVCAYEARNTCPDQVAVIERLESGQRVQISFSQEPSEAERTYWTEVPLDFTLNAPWLR